ncbi:hypothetical protein G9A89_006616 [Geosiphon pyriformis]|nr:hypothetical protein G9A89_006616 [Geosiphon pyriformis]
MNRQNLTYPPHSHASPPQQPPSSPPFSPYTSEMNGKVSTRYPSEGNALKKEMYQYIAPWPVYGLDWSKRPEDKAFRLALGSFIEEFENKLQIITLPDLAHVDPYYRSPHADFVKVAETDHQYPITKVLWEPYKPSGSESPDLLATAGDHLRLWEVTDDNQPGGNTIGANHHNGFQQQRLVHRQLLTNTKADFNAPLTSFDWNEVDTTLAVTSSIDTTCTVWNIETNQAKTQLIAHDKEVYDVAFASNTVNMFASVGADGSVRMFDLRALEHSTIIYETNAPHPSTANSTHSSQSQPSPLLRLCFNKMDQNYLATFHMDSPHVQILDVRAPGFPVAELRGHSATVNCVNWAPHQNNYLCSGGDDSQVLVWDLNSILMSNETNGTKRQQEPSLAYQAKSEISQLIWSSACTDFVAIGFGRTVQALRVTIKRWLRKIFDDVIKLYCFHKCAKLTRHLEPLFSKYDKLKLFFDYEATVGSVIAVMKKATKVSGSEGGFKMVASRKKRKGGVLAESIDNSKVADKALGNRSWGSEVGDTTESESIDMEEKCLVEETSVDYGENGAFTGEDPDQTPKSLHVKTKKVLEKPLGVIDYGTVDANGDVLDESFLLPPPFPVKPSVQVPVRKSFTLDIDLVAVVGVNGFGGASTPSKFSGIIRATFTSEEAMMTAANLANDRGVVVNTDLKRSAVHAAVTEFGIIKLIKMQLVGLWQKAIIELENQDQADFLASKWSIFIGKDAIRVAKADIDKQLWDARDKFRALLYTLPMGTTAHDLWDFIGSIGEKTCFINRNPISYSRARCATVCFSSEVELGNAMATTPVIKSFGLHWSCLSLASCAVCEKFGHTSLGCRTVKGAEIAGDRKALFSVQDQFRLAKIYARRSAPISRPLAFGGKTWALVVSAPSAPSLSGGKASSGSIVDGKPTPSVAKDLEKRLVSIEDSLVSLAKQIDGLAKRLDLLVLVVPQPGHRCWLPVVATPQNSESNVTLDMDLSMADGHESATIVDSSTSPHVVKLENMLEGLSKSVLILSARFDSLALAGGANFQSPSQ